MKALGTGVRGVGWRDIEVVRQRGRAPTVRLHGRAAEVGERLAVTQIALSISHSKEYAVVSVVMEAENSL